MHSPLAGAYRLIKLAEVTFHQGGFRCGLTFLRPASP